MLNEEYVDLRARLKNLEATEAQLLKVVQRAGRISDVLTVFGELSSVREKRKGEGGGYNTLSTALVGPRYPLSSPFPKNCYQCFQLKDGVLAI